MAQRRIGLWTSTNTTLVVDTAGIAGQKAVQTTSNLESGLGLAHLAGYTIVDTRVKVYAESSSAEGGNTLEHASLGIGVFSTGIDEGDFPNLTVYEGDWLWYGTMIFRLPGAVSGTVLPTEFSQLHSRSRAQRRIPDVGLSGWMVAQQSGGSDVNYFVRVEHYILMP